MSKHRLDFGESLRKSIGLKTDSQLAGDLRKGKDSSDPLFAGAALRHEEVLAPGLPQGRDNMAHARLREVFERQRKGAYSRNMAASSVDDRLQGYAGSSIRVSPSLRRAVLDN